MAVELAVWSKDIIFLVSDGYTSGAHAWINAYHEETQSSASITLLLLGDGSVTDVQISSAILSNYERAQFGLFCKSITLIILSLTLASISVRPIPICIHRTDRETGEQRLSMAYYPISTSSTL